MRDNVDKKMDALKMKRMTRADFLIGAAALLASAVGFAWLKWRPIQQTAVLEMIVFKHNQVVLRCLLSDSGEDIWTFGEPGGQNKVQRIGRRVRVLQADCPDQLCVRQGWIEKAGDQLLCIPNRLLVEIRSKGADVIDTVAR